jgi:hypothetical protein
MRRSSHVVALAAALAALAGSACSNPTVIASPDDEFTLRVGQSVVIADAGVRLTFIRVESDSRCPSDVDCIWAGNGRIEVEVRAGGMSDTLLLNTFDGAKEGVAGTYRVVFVELQPVPRSDRAIDEDDYRATLKVVAVGPACTEEARPGLMISLSDSTVPNFFDFGEVTVVAVDGAYRDSAFVADYNASSGPVALAYERAGVYTATVRAEGYQPWIREGIEVMRDACHVITVPVFARLAR